MNECQLCVCDRSVGRFSLELISSDLQFPQLVSLLIDFCLSCPSQASQKARRETEGGVGGQQRQGTRGGRVRTVFHLL